MKLLFTVFLFSLAFLSFAQSYTIQGEVYGDDGVPLVYSSVILMNPSDSTMEAFGITNKSGEYNIQNLKKGDYLVQVAFLGFGTYYQNISVPLENGRLPAIVLKAKSENIDEVQVSGEYVPLSIKKDTIEYNANAFKLRPDAVTEDLLKKLPGIEIDRAGNIKAMGEDVEKLFVDGKEFFGSDPKVATKNVPADAVDKVQVYDRKSEEAMFTGIDDGSREKAINLMLKEDKKNALFGDVMAGAGTGGHRQGSIKAYRFTDKVQVAALGMANNVNQYGFSFNDFMNFNGGIGQMIHGGGSARIEITSDGSFPINFGEPISGLNSSGAGGANFSYSSSPSNRAFISYLGSASKKELEESTKTRNYVEGDEYTQNQLLDETDENASHRFNLGLRKRIDTTQNILVDGNFILSNGNNNRNTEITSFYGAELVNNQLDYNKNLSDRISGSANGSYTKMIKNTASVVKIGGNLSLSQSLTNRDITSETFYTDPGYKLTQNIFQNDENNNLSYSGNATFTQKIGKRFYLSPEVSSGRIQEDLRREEQDNQNVNTDPYFSLPNLLNKEYTWFRPRLGLKRTGEKSTLSMDVQLEMGKLQNTLNTTIVADNNYLYFLPSVWYEYQFQTGRRMMLLYESGVNTPGISQLFPEVNSINPLSVFYGNPKLKPEVSHRFNAHYILFDQFSFTSLMATFSGIYVQDKINWVRNVNNNLTMVNTLDNFKSDYNFSGNIDFSTPLKRLGMKLHVNLDESWNKGLNLINNAENEYTNISHRASFSIDNRKKEKWDVNTGIEMRFTSSRYSVQSQLNNDYFNMSWFGELRFTPNNVWDFELSSDIASYSDKSFGESIRIPLLGAQINHYFLKNKRGTLSLKGFDLLDQNQIVKRFSELNYLREIRSNSIGRFVMLSFTYRLNKFGEAPGGIDVKMSSHR